MNRTIPRRSGNRSGPTGFVHAIYGLIVGLVLLTGCHTKPKVVLRQGDEMIVAGQYFHTGTKIVTWMDPGGYDAYRGTWHAQSPVPAGPVPADYPKHYGERRVSPNGPPVRPDLAGLQDSVDQFVLHYDETGLSKICFDVLNKRGLSVHFMLDVDGTVYQTLDLQERAWHGTKSNDRSVGIEIANIGAYPPDDAKVLTAWYAKEKTGQIRLQWPLVVGNPRLSTLHFTGRPLRPDLVAGTVQKQELVQYDYTPEQYAALIKLAAALHRVFPKIKLDYPRGVDSKVLLNKLPDSAFVNYQGLLGHFHIQENKIDPGPAFQWDLLINGARHEAATVGRDR